MKFSNGLFISNTYDYSRNMNELLRNVGLYQYRIAGRVKDNVH